MARVRVAGSGVVGPDEPPDLSRFDPNRLRRMDRFGRTGFLAGSLALLDAGTLRPETADPAAGVVFGSAFGCRDSITDHADLLRGTRTLAELRPALFAQTVHNSVNGELAIEWNLGGPSEVLVSGRCAGLEALTMAASFLRDRGAARVVAGGAEGMHASMLDAWRIERERFGERGADVEAGEAGAAFVLTSSEETSTGANVEVLGGTTFFEPDPASAGRRLAAWVRETSGDAAGVLSIASPDLDGALAPAALAGHGLSRWSVVGPAERELFGAAGPVAAVALVRRLVKADAEIGVVAVRDPDGPIAAVVFSRITPRSA